MDVAWGAKRVIACMTHTTKDGRPRILKQCTLPVTVKGKVSLIITDIAVMGGDARWTAAHRSGAGLDARGGSGLTEARLIVAADVTEITL